MRILSVDYGDVRVGLALSDVMQIIANPLPHYNAVSMRKTIDYVSKIAIDNDVKLIVVGLPINMDGTEGERASKTRSFATVLEKVSGKKVEFQDERLSSVQADKIMIQMDMRRDKRKQKIDSMSAQIILQNYLDKNKNN